MLALVEEGTLNTNQLTVNDYTLPSQVTAKIIYPSSTGKSPEILTKRKVITFGSEPITLTLETDIGNAVPLSNSYKVQLEVVSFRRSDLTIKSLSANMFGTNLNVGLDNASLSIAFSGIIADRLTPINQFTISGLSLATGATLYAVTPNPQDPSRLISQRLTAQSNLSFARTPVSLQVVNSYVVSGYTLSMTNKYATSLQINRTSQMLRRESAQLSSIQTMGGGIVFTTSIDQESRVVQFSAIKDPGTDPIRYLSILSADISPGASMYLRYPNQAPVIFDSGVGISFVNEPVYLEIVNSNAYSAVTNAYSLTLDVAEVTIPEANIKTFSATASGFPVNVVINEGTQNLSLGIISTRGVTTTNTITVTGFSVSPGAKLFLINEDLSQIEIVAGDTVTITSASRLRVDNYYYIRNVKKTLGKDYFMISAVNAVTLPNLDSELGKVGFSLQRFSVTSQVPAGKNQIFFSAVVENNLNPTNQLTVNTANLPGNITIFSVKNNQVTALANNATLDLSNPPVYVRVVGSFTALGNTYAITNDYLASFDVRRNSDFLNASDSYIQTLIANYQGTNMDVAIDSGAKTVALKANMDPTITLGNKIILSSVILPSGATMKVLDRNGRSVDYVAGMEIDRSLTPISLQVSNVNANNRVNTTYALSITIDQYAQGDAKILSMGATVGMSNVVVDINEASKRITYAVDVVRSGNEANLFLNTFSLSPNAKLYAVYHGGTATEREVAVTGSYSFAVATPPSHFRVKNTYSYFSETRTTVNDYVFSVTVNVFDVPELKLFGNNSGSPITASVSRTNAVVAIDETTATISFSAIVADGVDAGAIALDSTSLPSGATLEVLYPNQEGVPLVAGGSLRYTDPAPTLRVLNYAQVGNNRYTYSRDYRVALNVKRIVPKDIRLYSIQGSIAGSVVNVISDHEAGRINLSTVVAAGVTATNVIYITNVTLGRDAELYQVVNGSETRITLPRNITFSGGAFALRVKSSTNISGQTFTFTKDYNVLVNVSTVPVAETFITAIAGSVGLTAAYVRINEATKNIYFAAAVDSSLVNTNTITLSRLTASSGAKVYVVYPSTPNVRTEVAVGSVISVPNGSANLVVVNNYQVAGVIKEATKTYALNLVVVGYSPAEFTIKNMVATINGSYATINTDPATIEVNENNGTNTINVYKLFMPPHTAMTIKSFTIPSGTELHQLAAGGHRKITSGQDYTINTYDTWVQLSIRITVDGVQPVLLSKDYEIKDRTALEAGFVSMGGKLGFYPVAVTINNLKGVMNFNAIVAPSFRATNTVVITNYILDFDRPGLGTPRFEVLKYDAGTGSYVVAAEGQNGVAIDFNKGVGKVRVYRGAGFYREFDVNLKITTGIEDRAPAQVQNHRYVNSLVFGDTVEWDNVQDPGTRADSVPATINGYAVYYRPQAGDQTWRHLTNTVGNRVILSRDLTVYNHYYQVVIYATNSVGLSSVTAPLTFQAKQLLRVPSAVNPRTSGLDVNSVRAYIPLARTDAGTASDGSPAQLSNFLVEISADTNFISSTTNSVSANKSFTEIYGLNNGQTYFYRIQVVNNLNQKSPTTGAGVVKFTVPALTQASGVVAPTLPRDFAKALTLAGDYIFSWREPHSAGLINGQSTRISKYRLELTGGLSALDVSGDSNSVVVPKSWFSTGTSYTAEIYAYNPGARSLSEDIAFQHQSFIAAASYPSSAPRDLRLITNQEGNYVLSWAAPFLSGVVKGTGSGRVVSFRIVWDKPGATERSVILPATTYTHTLRLKEDLDYSSGYTIKVSAINDAPLESAGVAVSVNTPYPPLTPPGQIQNFSVTPININVARITWQPPSDGGTVRGQPVNITNYLVTYRVPNGNYLQQVSVSSNAIDLSVTQNVTYEYKITAVNAAGLSNTFVNTVLHRFIDPKPTTPSMLINNFAVTYNSVVVAWNPPTFNGHNSQGLESDIAKYLISYSTEPSMVGATNIEVLASHTTFISGVAYKSTSVTNLNPRTKYYFQMVAESAAGGRSAPVAFTATTFGLPESTPPRLDIGIFSAFSEKYGMLGWYAPEFNGHNEKGETATITGYRVEFSTSNDFNENVVSAPLTGYSGYPLSRLTINLHAAPFALIPNRIYHMRLRAINSLGQTSKPSVTKTFRSYLPPDTVQVKGITTDQLKATVSWTYSRQYGSDDMNGAGSFVFHRIKYSTNANLGYPAHEVMIDSPLTTSAQITGLLGNTQYFYQVQTYTTIVPAEGVRTPILSFTSGTVPPPLVEPTPGVVTGLTVKPYGIDTVVELSWIPPTHLGVGMWGSENMMGYEVLYGVEGKYNRKITLPASNVVAGKRITIRIEDLNDKGGLETASYIHRPYHFKVVAVNTADRRSAESTPVYHIVLSLNNIVTPAPPQITHVNYSAGSRALNVFWDPSFDWGYNNYGRRPQNRWVGSTGWNGYEIHMGVYARYADTHQVIINWEHIYVDRTYLSIPNVDPNREVEIYVFASSWNHVHGGLVRSPAPRVMTKFYTGTRIFPSSYKTVWVYPGNDMVEQNLTVATASGQHVLVNVSYPTDANPRNVKISSPHAYSVTSLEDVVKAEQKDRYFSGLNLWKINENQDAVVMEVEFAQTVNIAAYHFAHRMHKVNRLVNAGSIIFYGASGQVLGVQGVAGGSLKHYIDSWVGVDVDNVKKVQFVIRGTGVNPLDASDLHLNFGHFNLAVE